MMLAEVTGTESATAIGSNNAVTHRKENKIKDLRGTSEKHGKLSNCLQDDDLRIQYRYVIRNEKPRGNRWGCK